MLDSVSVHVWDHLWDFSMVLSMGSEMVRSLTSYWVTDLGSLLEMPSGLQKENSLGSMLGKGRARPWDMLKD